MKHFSLSSPHFFDYAIAALLSIGAVGLHAVLFANVGDPWRDEVGSIGLATMPNWAAIWDSIRHDSFPFLYYALLHAWIGAFGDSTTSIRTLGLSLGLGALGSIWWLAHRLRIGAPLLLLAMVAMSAAVIRYGDSVRAYGLGLITAALMLGAIWALLSDSSKKNIGFATIACIAAAHTTYQNSLLLFVIGTSAILATAINRRWRSSIAIAAICAVTATSLAGYLPAMSHIKSMSVMFQWSISIEEVFTAFSQTVSTGSEGWQKWVWLAAAVIGLAGAFASLLVPGKKLDPTAQDDAMTRSLFVALTIPLLGIVFTAFMTSSNYAVRPWHLLGLMLVLAAVLEAGIATMPAPPVITRFVRLVPALALGMLAVIHAPSELKRRATNIPDLIAAIERLGGPNDLVVFPEWYVSLTFSHLYRGSKEWITIPDLGRHSVHRWDLLKTRMQDANGVTREIEKIQRTLLAGNNVFVIGSFQRVPPMWAQTQLPPAPHPQAGWSSGYYTAFWAAQAMAVATSSGSNAKLIQAPASRETMMDWENPPLYVFSRGN